MDYATYFPEDIVSEGSPYLRKPDLIFLGEKKWPLGQYKGRWYEVRCHVDGSDFSSRAGGGSWILTNNWRYTHEPVAPDSIGVKCYINLKNPIPEKELEWRLTVTPGYLPSRVDRWGEGWDYKYADSAKMAAYWKKYYECGGCVATAAQYANNLFPPAE